MTDAQQPNEFDDTQAICREFHRYLKGRDSRYHDGAGGMPRMPVAEKTSE